MKVTVERIEPSGSKSLVFGTSDDGRKVSFHLPRTDAERMQAVMDRGDVVQADLPDSPDRTSKKN